MLGRASLQATFLLVTTAGLHAQAVSSRPETPAASPETTVVLSPFEISATSDDGYGGTESATASRFRQKLKDIPQSISILSDKFLLDVGAVELADVIPLLGGQVSSGTRSQDSFTVRGFAVQESYLDGIRETPEWGSGEFVHIQQLEVVKGPSSNLYANPKGLGGIINRVSKAPSARPTSALNLTIGNYNNYHFTAEASGPMNDAKTLLYRASFAYRDIEFFRDFKDLDRVFFAPIVEWRVSPATKVTFSGEYLKSHYQEDNWIPAALIAPGVRGLNVPIDRRIDEPWVNSTVERQRLRAIVEHQITGNLTARVALQQMYVDNPIEQVEFLGLAADNRTVSRRAFWLNRWEDYSYAEANLFGRYATGKVNHSFIFAGDFYYRKFRSNVRRVDLASLDLLNPVYNTPKPDFPASSAATNTLGEGDTYGYSGTYQLDAFENRLILVGGWRWSEVTSERYAQLGAGPFPLIVDPDTTAETPRYGALIRPQKNLTLYYQYSEVFQPQAGAATRPDGSPLDPIFGESEEFGVRLSFLDDKLNFEAVKYEVISDGAALRLPPPNNSFFENGGQQTSDGYEYTVTFSGKRLWLRAGWNTVDVRNTTGGVNGAQIAGEPEERASLLARYRFPNVGRHGGLSVGATFLHTGDRALSTSDTSQMIDAYQTYGLNANYGIAKGLRVAVAVNNLFDKETIAGNAGTLWRPLEPRTIKVTLTKQW